MFPVLVRCVARVLTGGSANGAIRHFRPPPVSMYSSPMAADPKLEHLAQVQMFSSLNKKELRLIAKAADVVTVKAGTEIVTEGTTGHEFYLVLSGQATVRRNGRKVATLGPGSYFGELALLDRGPRSATVVADTDMELAIISQREFLGVLDQVPAVALQAPGQHGRPPARGRHQSPLTLTESSVGRRPADGDAAGCRGRVSPAVVRRPPVTPPPAPGAGPPAGAPRDCSRTWATSITRTDSEADPSAWRPLVASSSMIRQ